MRFDILTLFPNMITSVCNESIIKRAIEAGKIEINVIDYREFSKDKNHKVDDTCYGGGAGMLIRSDIIVDCLKSIDGYTTAHKIITSPKGSVLNQKKAQFLSKLDHIIVVCGHYEGIDERIVEYMDEALSIGDYILTGGEIAALTIIDSVSRLVNDVLGNNHSSVDETFYDNLLEYPQYTKPVEFDGHRVPDVLLSGHHENIRKYRRFESLKQTYLNRPELLDNATLTSEDMVFLSMIEEGKDLKF